MFACICLWVTWYQACIYWKREYLYSCVSSNFLLLGLCIFIFPHLLNFPQNLFCFSYFYRGRKMFLKLLLFIGGVTYFSIVLISFVFPWFSIFSCPLLCMFLSTFWLVCLCQYVTKWGRNRWNVEKVFKMFLFRGRWNCF